MLNPKSFARIVPTLRPFAVPLVGLAYRSIHLRWFRRFTTANPIFPTASVSRYVPASADFAVLYFALDADTAYREGNQDFHHLSATTAGQLLVTQGGLRPEPTVLVGTHVTLARMLDLRLASVRTVLGIRNDADIQMPWKAVASASPTQLLGRAVHADAYFEGLVYPSVQRPGGDCLVVFTDRLRGVARIDFHGFRFPAATLADRRLP